MKSSLLLLLLITNALTSSAQIQNTNWFVGFGENNGRILKWSTNALSVVDSTQLGTEEASVSVSDKNGNLLFYSNGCKIYNRLHQPLLNGENIPCFPANYPAPGADATLSSGSETGNSIMVVNDPADSNRYYLFATDALTTNNVDEIFYYCIIDITLDGGLGGVVAPYIRLLDSLDNDRITGKVTAVRHANGRDWWILNPRIDIWLTIPGNPATGYIHDWYIKRYLLTPDGVIDTASQTYCHSATDANSIEGEIAVNKEGNKIAMCHTNRSVIVMDFDRCTGLISNCKVVDTLVEIDYFTGKFFWGVEFSPNSQLLYANTPQKLFQYNLADSYPGDTKYLVASHSAPSDGSVESQFFGYLQIGMDEKVYTSLVRYQYWTYTIADTPFNWLRRVEYPDSLGAACQMNNHALYIGVPTIALPNLANWTLGPLTGSECDTLHTSLTALVDEEKFTAQLFPNPATTEATLVLSKPAPYEMQLIVYDVLGKETMSVTVPRREKYIQLDLKPLTEGVYFYRLSGGNGRCINGKLVKLKE